jgi:hypothetical protein
MKKLMNHTLAAAGLAALLLTGACASNDGLGDQTDVADQVVQVRPEESGVAGSVYPAPGPAKVDSDGNVYASSAAPGSGNAATVGTNTNVNIVPERSTVEVRESALVTTETTTIDTTADIDTTPVVTTPTVTTTTTTTTVPMTSSVQETTTDDDEPAPVRTRMRKD